MEESKNVFVMSVAYTEWVKLAENDPSKLLQELKRLVEWYDWRFKCGRLEPTIDTIMMLLLVSKWIKELEEK